MEKTPYYDRLAASNSEINGKRISASEKKAMNAMYEEVRSRMVKVDAIKNKLMDLEDFFPDNTESLHATTKPFLEEKWAQDIINLKLDLEQAEIELDSARKTYKKWFRDKNPTDFLKDEGKEA